MSTPPAKRVRGASTQDSILATHGGDGHVDHSHRELLPPLQQSRVAAGGQTVTAGIRGGSLLLAADSPPAIEPLCELSDIRIHRGPLFLQFVHKLTMVTLSGNFTLSSQSNRFWWQ